MFTFFYFRAKDLDSDLYTLQTPNDRLHLKVVEEEEEEEVVVGAEEVVEEEEDMMTSTGLLYHLSSLRIDGYLLKILVQLQSLKRPSNPSLTK